MGNIINLTFLIGFFALCIILVLSLGVLILSLMVFVVRLLLKKPTTKHLKTIKSTMIFTLLIVGAALAISVISQFTTSTPPIAGEGAIAELIEVELNGEKQWISIRGKDQSAEILLFLAGGPGGSQLAAVRHELPELESEFLVIGWDQPGAAKSFNMGKTPTVNDYVQDGLALTEYLCARFGKEKIYIVGESWGSALGVMMASEKPERFHALTTNAQMVDFLETEIIDYAKAIELATQKGDTEKVVKLLENGPPPYYGKEVTWKIAAYINYLGNEMNANPQIKNPGYETFRDIFSQEYGIIDKINYLWGIAQTFNNVYPTLYGTDLRESHHTLEIPVKFIVGRHDINAPTELSEDYFEKLNAPYKSFIWFENSGHSAWINESDRFVEELVKMKEKPKD